MDQQRLYGTTEHRPAGELGIQQPQTTILNGPADNESVDKNWLKNNISTSPLPSI